MSNKAKFIAAVGAGAAALAVPLVMNYEGTVYRAYSDPIGIVTACTGSTVDLDGTRLNRDDLGRTYTKEQCEEMLYRDLAKHAEALDCVTRELTPGEAAAVVSFAYNVGNSAFCTSTFARRLNARDPLACAELSRWTLAGGRELPGLVKRRAAERALCERKDTK